MPVGAPRGQSWSSGRRHGPGSRVVDPRKWYAAGGESRTTLFQFQLRPQEMDVTVQSGD